MKRIAAALVLGFAIVGVASAARTETYKLSAKLNAAQEIPKQTFKVAGATGVFIATMSERGAIKWKLTFKGASGSVMAAHIHKGKKGKAGPVIVPLCGPCRSGQTGVGHATAAQVKAIESGGAYVNLHTAKNPAGEVRGQVVSSGG